MPLCGKISYGRWGTRRGGNGTQRGGKGTRRGGDRSVDMVVDRRWPVLDFETVAGSCRPLTGHRRPTTVFTDRSYTAQFALLCSGCHKTRIQHLAVPESDYTGTRSNETLLTPVPESGLIFARLITRV